MIKFKKYIAEAAGANLHMTHLEDAVLDGGVTGTRNVINYLRNIRDMLSGSTATPVSLTTKWDGAPAIFAGVDPSDGKFFVAKKGLFNKNPKLYKTDSEIDMFRNKYHNNYNYDTKRRVRLLFGLLSTSERATFYNNYVLLNFEDMGFHSAAI